MAEKNAQLKPGWRWVNFGDVVRQVKDKVDPEASGLERYVAGDHMDTDDLCVRRWGVIGSGYLGPAFHMRFRPSQVLYGSRRTYLRKVAVPDFEGICANTTFVLEPRNPSVLLPDFLPFLMQTDAFNRYSVKNSKGSVNPYINYSDLALFEFALPPMNGQRQLTSVLLSIEDSQSSLENLAAETQRLRQALMIDHFEGLHPEYRTVQQVGTWYSGGTPSRGNPAYWGGEIPWISPKDMKHSELGTSEEKVTPEGVEAGSRLTPIDTIMIVVRGMILAHTFPVARTTIPAAFNQDMKALVVSPEFRPKYIQYWFEFASAQYLQLVSSSSHGTKRLESDRLFSLQVPKLELQEQDTFIARIDGLRGALAHAEARLKEGASMKSHFLNEYLAPKEGEHVSLQ